MKDNGNVFMTDAQLAQKRESNRAGKKKTTLVANERYFEKGEIIHEKHGIA